MTVNEPETTSTPRAPRYFWTGKSALVMPALLVALGCFLVYGIASMDVADDSEIFGPKAFPAITAGFCFLIAALLTWVILRNPEVAEPIRDEDGKIVARLTSNWRSTGLTVGSFVVFAVLLIPAGWIIAGAIVFWGVTVGLGSTQYVKNLLIGLAASSIMQLVFSGLLGLNLPPGVMGML
ncbi:tripartite tricarboxylate transporter TctB family protein [[Mycobacterium] wendilense]|uniref:Tripartite tricarboxylate transporter TctB family protein n=1 Tax=[Mycobacterium] wendilense TaxID=3064284 RepID=A0ABN9NYP5_9MYCO|nr:tripartite tricarboxylate transporter TctB family protein [Mycolicibacterium sp. MU0050]CAJ1582402.1 tripartite tricarboxylate transporter TctB family protein [Mycolicibacterium sp. MU0050]